MSGLVFQPLQPGNIRLFQVSSTNGTLSVKLDDYAIKSKPKYMALSYTWGSSPFSRTVLCNDATLHVSESLHQALTSLLKLQLIQDRTLMWVDQLCINQADVLEKATQVNRMWLIFQNASQVFAWLGPHDANSRLVFEQAQTSGDALGEFRRVRGTLVEAIQETELEQFMIPGTGDPFWPALTSTIDRAYFRRAWTFPETVLASSLVMVCGNSSMRWSLLSSIVGFASNYGLERLLYPVETPRAEKSTVAWAIRAISLGRADVKAGRSLNYANIVRIVQERAVTQVCDRVYSMRSLLSQAIQDSIPVDYSIYDGQRVLELFIIAGKAGLQFDPHLRTLECKSQAIEQSTLPSWCPDPRPVRSMPIRLPHQYFHAGIDADNRQAIMQVRQQSSWVRVSGMRLDRVSKVATRRWQWQCGDVLPDNLQWHEECLALAQEATACSPDEVPWEHICALTCTMPTSTFGEIEAAEIRQAFDDFLDDTRARQRGELRPLKIRSPNEVSGVVAYFPTTLVDKAYFITEDGRIGVGHPSIRTGDEVVSLYGGRPIYILRRIPGKQAHDVELVGDAYVSGLMDLAETRETIPEASDEMFVVW